MKVSNVAVAAGNGFTNVRATMGAHHMRAVENAAPMSTIFEVQWPDDNFTQIYTYPGGMPIERFGNGNQGILQPPPGYFAQNQPALGGIYFKIRDKSGGGTNLKLLESETTIPDDID